MPLFVAILPNTLKWALYRDHRGGPATIPELWLGHCSLVVLWKRFGRDSTEDTLRTKQALIWLVSLCSGILHWRRPRWWNYLDRMCPLRGTVCLVNAWVLAINHPVTQNQFGKKRVIGFTGTSQKIICAQSDCYCWRRWRWRWRWRRRRPASTYNFSNEAKRMRATRGTNLKFFIFNWLLEIYNRLRIFWF